MNTLLEAADEFNEDEVKNAGGGRVLVGAVPMEEQVKQLQGGPASPGGPRVPPPGMESMPQGVPPGQQPPTMKPAPVPKPGLPRVGPDRKDED
ncbi:hypothetical protein B6U90_05600 [Thermoplasmatales archaeon ex4484_6]|nr:MAG: hypothetical protein B6U90_05600 [Thermoplasmatales archaeon ex4484_6]